VSVEARVRASGLLRAGEPMVVLLSGGRDSVCLLDLAVRIGCDTAALHVDHALRPDSAEDVAFCRELCARLNVELTVRTLDGEPVGNLQAWARERRYGAARALAAPRGAAIATGHTATDQVETVLYRLAASPGRRALLGMEPRGGDVVRPLLSTTRDETAAHCREHGLPWREDPSNDSDAYARNRVRAELLPALRRLHPAAEANVLRTLELLRDEAAVLDAAVAVVLAEAGDPPAVEHLRALPPALARLVVRRLADGAAVAHRTEEILALAEGQALDVGEGLRATIDQGRLRFVPTPPRVRA
jgi:tRNA(Ile)-lysidine synthase